MLNTVLRNFIGLFLAAFIIGCCFSCSLLNFFNRVPNDEVYKGIKKEIKISWGEEEFYNIDPVVYIEQDLPERRIIVMASMANASDIKRNNREKLAMSDKLVTLNLSMLSPSGDFPIGTYQVNCTAYLDFDCDKDGDMDTYSVPTRKSIDGTESNTSYNFIRVLQNSDDRIEADLVIQEGLTANLYFWDDSPCEDVKPTIKLTIQK